MRTRSSKGSLSALGAALVTVLVLGALLGSASASAATQHWYGYGGGTPLAEKTSTEVVAEDLGAVSIKYTYSGAELTIDCGSMSANGAIENPSGGGNGTLGGAIITFGECAVTHPSGGECTVPSTIETVKVKGEATKYGGLPAIKYSPESGSTFTTFEVSGGGCPSYYKGLKTLNGSFTAEYLGGGNYLVSQLSSAGLTWVGQPVTMVSRYKLSSKAGKAVAAVTDPLGQHWYLGGAPAEGAKTKLAEGSSVGYSSLKGSMSFTVSALISGIKNTVQCGGSLSGTAGSVENPAGGGAGSATSTITFAGCTVSEPAGKCTVETGGAKSTPLSGLATEAGAAPAVTFSSAEKAPIVTFVIQGSSCPAALKGSKNVTGSLTGVPDAFGTYAFSPGVNSNVKYAGLNATVSAQSTLETSIGERLGLAP